ncbi:hypothetical protein AFLA_013897 [Aspergillus flavus NRRL3357]|nr:hypothetical protein AFLA_013897 [Aspergillus flavus NRRL3357]
MSLCWKPSDIQSLKPRLIRQQWPGLHTDVAAKDAHPAAAYLIYSERGSWYSNSSTTRPFSVAVTSLLLKILQEDVKP